MKPVNEALQQKILDTSRSEFLEHGYDGTTLRSIAASVGCTTGAIYRYYKGKAALFDALVQGPAEQLLKRFKERALSISSVSEEEQFDQVPDMSANEFDWMIDYIYDHYGVFRLICCASEGTRYENYIESLIEVEEEESVRFIRQLQERSILKRDIAPIMTHILANTLFSGIFETVRHDLSRDAAMEHMNTLQQFYLGGWVRILEMD